MSHTPGPWTFSKGEYGVRRIVMPERGTQLCDEPHYPWCPDDDADWILMAAAPELLAALKDLLTQESVRYATQRTDIGLATAAARAWAVVRKVE